VILSYGHLTLDVLDEYRGVAIISTRQKLMSQGSCLILNTDASLRVSAMMSLTQMATPDALRYERTGSVAAKPTGRWLWC
jgi:hypothetical protein